MEEISLAGLRQCFYDPDVRIRQMDNLEVWNYPKLTQLSVTQGFLQDQVICFHEGLNSIVGGKGVGKSLIIELIRFVLDQSSNDETIAKDHNSKVKYRLGNLGEVHLKYEIENGEKYLVCRKFDDNINEIKCQNLTTGLPFEGKISRIFPILAYSQNEIIKIAEDEQAQLRLIDSFYDSSSFSSGIHSIENRLRIIDRNYADAINADSELTEVCRELNTLEEELRHINSSFDDELFKEIELLEKKEEEFQNHLKFHATLISNIAAFVENLIHETQLPSENAQFSGDIELTEAYILSDASFSRIQSELSACKENIDVNRANLTRVHEGWIPVLTLKRAAYEEMLKTSGGNKTELEGKRRSLNRNISQKREEVEKCRKRAEKLNAYCEERRKLLDDLDTAYAEYYQTRMRIFEGLAEKAEGRLDLKIEQGVNKDRFIGELVSLVAGSGIRRQNLENIAKSLSPREFVEIVIQGNNEPLVSNCDLSEQNASRIIGYLKAKENFEDVLALCYLAYPEDVPSIKYQKDDGEYYPLNALSVGQKCTALLIIALSDGVKPIIIDQPEDSLDNPSVYDDIVSKLRSGKEKRQFILTTHNSNVGVASDSDNFIIIKGTASCCTVKCCGAIDNSEVRSGIIDHLEGGNEPFELKSRKYRA
jgi:ABC-type lipoprotein export system ATPase subunit